MSEIRVESDEWYPVYFLMDNYGRKLEVTDRQKAFIDFAFAAFDDVQAFLSGDAPDCLTDAHIESLADVLAMIAVSCACMESMCVGCEKSDGPA